MDKSKALERLSALESEAQELRKIIEAPEPAPMPPSLLTKPVPGSDKPYYEIGSRTHGEFICNPRNSYSESEHYYKHGNLFQTKHLAKDYAKAFDTFLLLRHQPGTVPASHGEKFFIKVGLRGEGCYVTSSMSKDIQMALLSPCFATEEDAERAIETIGQERLIHMFKTFHHTL